MAAETSPDAYIPVMFALAKLGVFFAWEYAQEVSYTTESQTNNSFTFIIL